jgi:CubicO group peptidase (beta-lactamase class C family)
MRPIFLRFSVAISLAGPLAAQAPSLPADIAGGKVDSIVRDAMQKLHIVGAAVVVMRHDTVLKSGTYGVMSLATQAPVKPDTRFFIASITKTVVGVAILRLADEGKLSLDESVGAILSDLPPAWRAVTVRQLATNTSGIPDNLLTPGEYMPSRAVVLERLRDSTLHFKPGDRFEYIQTNWMLLQDIIRARSGMAFDEFVRSRVLAPNGAPHAYFADYRALQPNSAAWYTNFVMPIGNPPRHTDEAKPLETEYPAYAWAAAGLNTSAEELARWTSAVAQGRVVKPSSVVGMWTPAVIPTDSTNNETLGAWQRTTVRMRPAVLAEGGARSSVLHVIDLGLTIVAVTNTQGAEENRWIRDIARVYVPARVP